MDPFTYWCVWGALAVAGLPLVEWAIEDLDEWERDHMLFTLLRSLGCLFRFHEFTVISNAGLLACRYCMATKRASSY